MATKDKEKEDEMQTAYPNEVAPAESDSPEVIKSDLSKPLWSVVTFSGCAESGLTYDEAVASMALLATEQVSGLCIVTDDAAAKLGN